MRCIKCELENRAGRKFCASCGTALPVPCENCGFANEAAERYCGGCGHPLVGERIGAIEADRNVDPEGDRRPVTVLFCDLVGYTHLSSVLDAEDVHALLERFFALVDATVDRFGGTIDKHTGDAAMALFGAPLARAERAVRAALEIQTSVPKLASGLPSALAVHIGIATGEVIASSVGSQHHRGYTVTGEAANIAARLLEKAISGETLVSHAVYQATNHVVSYDPLGATGTERGWTSRRGLATDRSESLSTGSSCAGWASIRAWAVPRSTGRLRQWRCWHRPTDPR